MAKYNVRLTEYAIGQIADTIAYISKVLLAPATAEAWVDLLKKEIQSLDEMPGRFALVDRAPWNSQGIRKMPVKNFIVYYFINENAKTVWVTAVVYGRRDQITALKEMPAQNM